MTEITVQIPDKLAKQVELLGDWLPTIIELSMVGFRNPMTARTSSELIQFLSKNPTPQDVLDYKVSDESQERISHLLELNREGEISEEIDQELDEWEKIEHIATLLFAQAGKLINEKV